MASFESLFAPCLEFFTLRRARRAVLAYSPRQRDRVAAARAAGLRREQAADGIEDSVAACILFREALWSYRDAAALAGEAVTDRVPDAALEGVPGAALERAPGAGPDGAPGAALEGVPGARLDGAPDAALEGVPGAALGGGSAADQERVAHALATSDPYYFDGLGREELELTRNALARAAPGLRARVEARSMVNLQFTRVGRVLGTVLGLVLAVAWITDRGPGPDLADGKPVTAGSFAPASTDGHDFVGGDTGASYTISTTTREPWVQVDLLAVYKLTRVEVFNRTDSYFDDSLPIALQVSRDGTTWEDVARLDNTFGPSPWVTRLRHKAARYVRIRGLNPSNGVTLSKLRVYGKP